MLTLGGFFVGFSGGCAEFGTPFTCSWSQPTSAQYSSQLSASLLGLREPSYKVVPALWLTPASAMSLFVLTSKVISGKKYQFHSWKRVLLFRRWWTGAL